MPGRQFSLVSYRFGFNGKEEDDEVKGDGSQQDYGMRIYDPRLGRFLSIDPITKKYPMLTPFQFASNTPIQAIDLDGLELLDYRTSMYYMIAETKLKNQTYVSTRNIPKSIASSANGEGGIYFKYKVAGRPTTDGEPPEGLSLVETIDERESPPTYAGLNPELQSNIENCDMSAGDIPSDLRSNDFSSLKSGNPNDNNWTRGNTILGALKEIYNMYSNYKNTSIWNGLYQEKVNRKEYYKATSLTDAAFSNGTISPSSGLSDALGRAAITNYILDGSDTYDPNYTPSEYRNVVIKFNVEAMSAAMTIMNKNGIAISDEFKAKFKAYSDELGSLKTKKAMKLFLCFIILLCLYRCQSNLTHSEMIDSFLVNLHESDSNKCLNSIEYKRYGKKNNAKKVLGEIENGIRYFKTHPIPAFNEFDKSVTKVAPTIFYTEYILNKKEENITYVMKFTFANFVSDKIYDYKCDEVTIYNDSTYDSANGDPTKDEYEVLQTIKPTFH